MEKKYQVFVSSTYKDLIEERQKVVEAILNAGHIPAGMELFKAGPKQEIIIREWIEASDIYVLILGPRYGSMNEQESISYTQWEYNLAKELGKPMFSLVLTDDYIQKMVDDKRIPVKDLETSNPLYQNFRDEVMDSLVEQITHPAEIRSAISDSIHDIERRYPEKLEGWIKGSHLNELEELRIENKKLSLELVNRQGEVIVMQNKSKPVKDDYIGEFSFDAIRDVLSSAIIEEEQLEDALDEVNDRKNNYFSNETEYDEYLSSIKFLEGSSALTYLLNTRNKLLSNEFKVDSENPVDILISRDYISVWEQFSLVKKIRWARSTVTYQLTGAGKKFISMADISSVQDNIK